LKDLVRDVLNIDLSKQQQSSDWGADSLSEAQLAYAASDVLHLHALRERLDAMLAREGRIPLAQACFDFLPTRAKLDLLGWEAEDIFAHSLRGFWSRFRHSPTASSRLHRTAIPDRLRCAARGRGQPWRRVGSKCQRGA